MFEQLLMQITNATTTVPATDLYGQINTLATTISLLVTTVGGIVVYIITKYRQVRKEDLTERDKWILDAMKGSQITAQKAAEQIGQSKDIIKTMFELNVPPDKRKEIEAKVGPMLGEANERLRAANEQAAMIKAKAVSVFGEAGDVDKDLTVPREDAKVSTKLRSGG
jgi:hypothetical protein